MPPLNWTLLLFKTAALFCLLRPLGGGAVKGFPSRHRRAVSAFLKKKKGQRERKQRGRSVLLATATNSPTSPLILFFIRCTRMQSLERCGNPRTLLSPPKSSHLPLNMIARRVTGSCFQIKARRSGVTLFDSVFILVAVGFLPAAGTFRGK